MALSKIDEIFVYTSSSEQPVDTYELYAWLDHVGIPYSKLDYLDPEQFPLVFSPLNTWWQPDDNGEVQPPVTDFPLVVYTEIHSDKPVSYLPRKYIAGVQNIKDTLLDLYQLGR